MKVMAECLDNFSVADKHELTNMLARRSKYSNPHIGFLAMLPVYRVQLLWKDNMCGCPTCHRINDQLNKELGINY